MKKLILLFLLLSGTLSAQSLNKPELAVMATVKQQLPETEALLEKIVNINSGTLNKEGVRQVGNLMADELEKLGFKTEWISFPDSSQIFTSMGYGAIYEAIRIVNEFRRVLGQEKYLTLNPGLIVGGAEIQYSAQTTEARVVGKENIVAGTALVKGDLRFLTEAQKENARAQMREIVEKSLPLTKATITFDDLIPSMEPTAANEALRQQLDKLSQGMGLGPVQALDPGLRGAGDISFVAKYLPCLDGLGASGKGAHSIEESMNPKELPQLIQRAALFIYRLTQ